MFGLADLAHTYLKPTGIIAVTSVGILCSACAGTDLLSLSGPDAKLAQASAKSKDKSNDNMSELDRAIVYWGQKSSENPKDHKALLNYVRNLKAAGRKRQALAVLQQASMYHGNSREFAGEYGRLALALGQTSIAEKMLRAADNPAEPDWRIISALGTAQAKQGQYNKAIKQYQRALLTAPNKPSLLNNLAMAYAATGKASDAETSLRRAIQQDQSNAKIRKNLALVLSLQGKHQEAQQIMAANTTGLRGTTIATPPSKSGWVTKFAQIQ